MLIGQYEHTIDNKKRLALPAKFRGELGEKVVITRGIDNCLVIYTLEEWKSVSEKLSQLPGNQAEARSFARIMLAGAMEVILDKLGRILVPDYLKSYADLKKNVVICGLSNRLEVWDSEEWNKYKKEVEGQVSDIASKLSI